jgi:hypothetical protein
MPVGRGTGFSNKGDIVGLLRSRSSVALLLAVLILGVILRYPRADSFFEAGADGSYYVALSQIVTRFGRAPWAVSPFSYFGLFPFSEGSAIPVLLAGFARVSGLPVDLAVVVMTDLAAVVGALGVFLCVLRTTRSTFGGIIGALAFLTAPILLLYSDQTLTSRFYAASWIPWLLLVFIEHRRWGEPRTLLIGFMLAGLLATTHLSFILIFAMLFGIVLLRLIERGWRRTRVDLVALRPLRRISKSYYVSFLAACGLLVIVTSYVPVAYGNGGSGLGSYDIGVFQGTSPIAQFGNLLISTAGGAGVIAAVLTLFAPRLWNLANRQFTFPALAAILLMFALLSVRLYVRPFVATLMAIGAGLGVVSLRSIYRQVRLIRWRPMLAAIALVFIVASVGSSLVIEERWSRAETVAVSANTYSTFLYAKHSTRGTFYCNQYPSDRFLTAYTGIMCSPALPGSDLDMVPFITGSIPWSTPVFSPRQFSGLLSSGTSFSLFDVSGYNPYDAYFQLSTGSSTAGRDLLDRYQVTYAFQYRALPHEYAIRWTFDRPQPSAFLRSLEDTSYTTYQDGSYALWYI